LLAYDIAYNMILTWIVDMIGSWPVIVGLDLLQSILIKIYYKMV